MNYVAGLKTRLIFKPRPPVPCQCSVVLRRMKKFQGESTSVWPLHLSDEGVSVWARQHNRIHGSPFSLLAIPWPLAFSNYWHYGNIVLPPPAISMWLIPSQPLDVTVILRRSLNWSYGFKVTPTVVPTSALLFFFLYYMFNKTFYIFLNLFIFLFIILPNSQISHIMLG